jgi:hypothetical protein
MRFILKFRAFILPLLLCFTFESAVYGQYGSSRVSYNAPTGGDEAGQVLEEACNYPIKTYSTKKQICSETLRLMAERNGEVFSEASHESEIVYCVDQNTFTSVAHTFFVTTAGRKTMTKTKIEFSGARECETEFVRIFAHYVVSAEGRIDFVPSQLKALETTCKK